MHWSNMKNRQFFAWFLSALFEHPPNQHCNSAIALKRWKAHQGQTIVLWKCERPKLDSNVPTIINLINKMNDKSIYIPMAFTLCIMIMINWWKYVKHTLIFSHNEPFVEKYVYKKNFFWNVIILIIYKMSQIKSIFLQKAYHKCPFHALKCSLMLSLPVQTAASLLLLIAQKQTIEHILKDKVDLTKSLSLNLFQ